MSGLYEELKELLHEEKSVASATVVRGEKHIGAKMLVFPDKSVHGTLGNATLDALAAQDAERAIWSEDAGTRTYAVEDQDEALAFDVFIEGFLPPPTLVN